MSRSILLLSLVFLIYIAFTEGQHMFMSQRCTCFKIYKKLRPENIKKWKVHKPSAFCDTTEIGVTLKNPQVEVCLNPESQMGRRLKSIQ
ncbi:LOW QUALITY PROTEIN: C-X-C motif chemokine 10 [Xyrauchen texanus]|uniref:LOW QUALITY PROTEIN: C-X-C motif chemokine 10 n=1 Tax=Xyrauchen texanus TaxID=154827 RepID=UPI002241E250|nr:LOW QUALITY PROTEIN: C-X-C motif chemokine 10 [Xyrauchen texanus]